MLKLSTKITSEKVPFVRHITLLVEGYACIANSFNCMVLVYAATILLSEIGNTVDCVTNTMILCLNFFKEFCSFIGDFFSFIGDFCSSFGDFSSLTGDLCFLIEDFCSLIGDLWLLGLLKFAYTSYVKLELLYKCHYIKLWTNKMRIFERTQCRVTYHSNWILRDSSMTVEILYFLNVFKVTRTELLVVKREKKKKKMSLAQTSHRHKMFFIQEYLCSHIKYTNNVNMQTPPTLTIIDQVNIMKTYTCSSVIVFLDNFLVQKYGRNILLYTRICIINTLLSVRLYDEYVCFYFCNMKVLSIEERAVGLPDFKKILKLKIKRYFLLINKWTKRYLFRSLLISCKRLLLSFFINENG